MDINNATITLTKDELNKIYNESSEEKRKVLKELFGEKLFKFDYHSIKTFEDACVKLGIQDYIPVSCTGADFDAYKQAQALYKLLVIQKAINNNTRCDESGLSWYPCWVLYTKGKLEYRSEKAKQRKGIKQLLSCATLSITEGAGISYTSANYREGLTFTNDGFPLCFNSEEAALYAAKQFESLFFDYYGIEIKD